MRDRLAELNVQEFEEAPRESHDSVTLEMEQDEEVSLMEAFFEKVTKLKTIIDELDNQIPEIERKHQEIINAVSKAKISQYQTELRAMDDDMSNAANLVRRNLKELENENNKLEAAGHVPAPDIRVRKTQQASLSRKFMQVISKYNDLQATMRRKQRDVVKRQCQVVDPYIAEADVDRIIEHGSAEGIFSGYRLAEAQQALEDIQDRHREFLRLERSLKELHDMFVDLAILIESQGDTIDRIELSVSGAVEFVQKGVEQLQEAKKLHASAGRKKWYIAICLFLILLICIIAFTSLIPVWRSI